MDKMSTTIKKKTLRLSMSKTRCKLGSCKLQVRSVIRRPSQKKCAERNTYRIEHQMCGKVLYSFSVVSLLPNDCIPPFWKVHDTRQVSRTVELSGASGNGSRKVLQRRETHTKHVDFQFWEQVEVRGTPVGAVGRIG